MEQFTDALRSAGLEKCNLMVAIDFTKSNTWQGTTEFGGKCLHFLTSGSGKPLLPTYESAFSQVAPSARERSDPYVKPISVRPVVNCFKIDEVIEAYENAVQNNGLSGNTQFAPIVEWAQTKEYHILLIIGDGYRSCCAVVYGNSGTISILQV